MALEALHLVGLAHTTVTLSTRVASSIHMTQCTDCRIYGATCQQVRIHESTNVRMTVESILLLAGAILEDSKDIVFCVVHPHSPDSSPTSPPMNSHHRPTTHMDVKDFSWLRSGIPSPNFRIEDVTAAAAAAAANKVSTAVMVVDEEEADNVPAVLVEEPNRWKDPPVLHSSIPSSDGRSTQDPVVVSKNHEDSDDDDDDEL